MKIFFYDGNLSYFESAYQQNALDSKMSFVVDAKEGPTNVRKTLEDILKFNKAYSKNTCVLTNSTIALDNDFAWNTKLNKSEIYIWRDHVADFVNVHDLTDKEIRFAHNIAKMYLAGAFGLE